MSTSKRFTADKRKELRKLNWRLTTRPRGPKKVDKDDVLIIGDGKDIEVHGPAQKTVLRDLVECR